MAFKDSIQNAGKRLGAAVLAAVIFFIAILVLFEGLVLFSIVLHIIGLALVIYIAYQSAPPR